MLRAALKSARIRRSHNLSSFPHELSGQTRSTASSSNVATYNSSPPSQPKKQDPFLAGFFNAALTPSTRHVPNAELRATKRQPSREPVASTSRLPSSDQPVEPTKSSTLDRALLRVFKRLSRALGNNDGSHMLAEGKLDLICGKMGHLQQLLSESNFLTDTRLQKRAVNTVDGLSRLLENLANRRLLGSEAAMRASKLFLQLIDGVQETCGQVAKRNAQIAAFAATLIYLTGAGLGVNGLAIKTSMDAALHHFALYTSTRSARPHQMALLEYIADVHGSAALLPFLERTGFALLANEKSRIVDRLVKEALADDLFLDMLGNSMEQAKKEETALPIQSRKIWTIHSVLSRQSLRCEDARSPASRMYGPTAGQRNAFIALKFLLSTLILQHSGKAQVGSSSTNSLQTPHPDTWATMLALLSACRGRHLPPDRQIIASVLHIARICAAQQRRDLDQYLDWSWQEWTLLRESDVQRGQDETIMAAFLDVIDATGSTTWRAQALKLAVLEAGLTPSSTWRSRYTPVLDDSTIQASSEMARSIALAALRLDQVEIALNCLFECRMSARHALQVLQGLVQHPPSEKASAARLADIIATFIRLNWHQTPPSLSGHHPYRLTPVMLFLFRHQYFSEGLALLRSLHTPLLLGSHNLSTVLRNLVYHRRSRSALSVFHSIPVQSREEMHWLPLLASKDVRVSDRVWEELSHRVQAKKPLTLDARLVHHIKADGRRYRQALGEYRQFQQLAEASLTTKILLLDLHVKAGRRAAAFDAYNHISKLPSAPSNLINHILPVLSQPGKPYYRKMGPVSTLRGISQRMDQLVLTNASRVDGVTANIILGTSLRWGELDNEAIWSALRTGLEKVSQRSWTKEIRPLYRMVIRAFLARGNKEDARKVVVMMAQEKAARSL